MRRLLPSTLLTLALSLAGTAAVAALPARAWALAIAGPSSVLPEEGGSTWKGTIGGATSETVRWAIYRASDVPAFVIAGPSAVAGNGRAAELTDSRYRALEGAGLSASFGLRAPLPGPITPGCALTLAATGEGSEIAASGLTAGAYLIEGCTPPNGERALKILCVTGVALMADRDADRVCVAAALAGAGNPAWPMQITVSAGGRPVAVGRPDASGFATIALPPAVRFDPVLIAASGNAGVAAIEAPPHPAVAAALRDMEATASGAVQFAWADRNLALAGETVRVAGVWRAGAPARPVVRIAGPSAVGPFECVSDGRRFAAELALPASMPAGSYRIELGTGDAVLPLEVRTEGRGRESLSLELNRQAVRPGDAVAATVRVTGADGLPLRDVAVVLAPEHADGTAVEVPTRLVTAPDGTATHTVRAPSVTGRQPMRLRASIAGGAAQVAQVEVFGEELELVLSAPASAPGNAPVELAVSAVDFRGVPVATGVALLLYARGTGEDAPGGYRRIAQTSARTGADGRATSRFAAGIAPGRYLIVAEAVDSAGRIASASTPLAVTGAGWEGPPPSVEVLAAAGETGGTRQLAALVPEPGGAAWVTIESRQSGWPAIARAFAVRLENRITPIPYWIPPTSGESTVRVRICRRGQWTEFHHTVRSGAVRPLAAWPVRPSPGASGALTVAAGGSAGERLIRVRPAGAASAATNGCAAWGAVRAAGGGTAAVPFQFPPLPGSDRRFRVDVAAVGDDGSVTLLSEGAACEATLRAVPSFPPYLLPGDRTVVNLVVENRGSERQFATPDLRVTDPSILSIEVPGPGTVPDDGTARFPVAVSAHRPGTGVVVGRLTSARAQLPVSFDIPVVALARSHESALSRIVEGGKPGKLERPATAEASAGPPESVVYVTPDTAVLVAQAAEWLASGDRGWNGEPWAVLSGLAAAKRALDARVLSCRSLGRAFAAEGPEALDALRIAGDESGWGIPPVPGTPDRWSSIQVVHAVTDAREAGATVDAALWERCRVWTDLALLPAGLPADERAEILALRVRLKIDTSVASLRRQLAGAFPALDLQQLSTLALARLVPVLKAAERSGDAEAALTALRARASTHEGNNRVCFWGSPADAAAFNNLPVVATSAALTAFAAAAPDDPLAAAAVRWFALTRSGPGWGTSVQTAIAVRALAAQAVARPGRAPIVPVRATAGEALRICALDGGVLDLARWRFELGPNDQSLTLDSPHDTAVSWQIRYAAASAPMPGESLSLTKRVYRLDRENAMGGAEWRRLGAVGDEVRAGDALLVEIEVTVSDRSAAIPFVSIRDRVPAFGTLVPAPANRRVDGEREAFPARSPESGVVEFEAPLLTAGTYRFVYAIVAAHGGDFGIPGVVARDVRAGRTWHGDAVQPRVRVR